LNYSFCPVPAAVAAPAATAYEGQQYGVEAFAFTQRKNMK
jgi:hypothetical protein